METEAEKTPETEQAEAEARKLHAEWNGRLEEAAREMKPFYAFVKRVDHMYGTAKDRSGETADKSPFRIAWANRETIQSAVYQRPPVCVAKTRFATKDPAQKVILRLACDIVERSVNTTMDLEEVHAELLDVRNDLVDYARGTIWLRYEAETAQQPAPFAPEVLALLPPEQQVVEMVVSERVCADFVSHADYLHSPARREKEIWWKARRSWMTKDAFKRRFPNYKGVLNDGGLKTNNSDEDGPDKTVPVWEIWDKEANKVLFLCPLASEILEHGEPHLNLRGFWPCPASAYGTLIKRSLVPKPDIMFYEGQLRSIDKMTQRIDALQQALKVRGFYPGGADEDGAAAVEAAVKSNDDRAVMIPVPGWAAIAGGDKSLGIVWLPIDQVVVALNALVQQRRQLIDDVYQITGISDIMRGQSQASETARAQEIKTQWGSTRIRSKQAEMQRVAKETCAIIAEIIVEHFQPETILKMAQTAEPEAQQAIDMLKDDGLRSLLIDIETDSTVAADEQADKAARVEFVGMLGGMVEKVMPVVQAAPELIPMFGDALKFTARGFRIGRELEQTIDDAVDALVQKAEQAKAMAAAAAVAPPPMPGGPALPGPAGAPALPPGAVIEPPAPAMPPGMVQ